MTKEEIRVLTLAKARLGPGMTVYDIGSGTGSVAVEAARLVAPAEVLAVDGNPEACALVRENAHRFGLKNVRVITGMAPAALKGLPPPDRVFIGGSGGHLEDILADCHQVLRPGALSLSTPLPWKPWGRSCPGAAAGVTRWKPWP